jgi:hypothetical protein
MESEVYPCFVFKGVVWLTLRLATFNADPPFERAKALNTTTWAQASPCSKRSSNSTRWAAELTTTLNWGWYIAPPSPELHSR